MKILYFLILLNTSAIFAQNVSFNQILNLRTKNLAEIEETLTNMNWTYLEGEEEKEGSLGLARFVEDKSKKTDRGQAFFTYYYSTALNTKRINVQIFKKDIYTKYVNEIKMLGLKMIKSEIKDGNIVKSYQGKTTTIEITVIVELENNVTTTWYSFFITSNSDYTKNYQ